MTVCGFNDAMVEGSKAGFFMGEALAESMAGASAQARSVSKLGKTAAQLSSLHIDGMVCAGYVVLGQDDVYVVSAKGQVKC